MIQDSRVLDLKPWKRPVITSSTSVWDTDLGIRGHRAEHLPSLPTNFQQHSHPAPSHTSEQKRSATLSLLTCCPSSVVMVHHPIPLRASTVCMICAIITMSATRLCFVAYALSVCDKCSSTVKRRWWADQCVHSKRIIRPSSEIL